MRQVRSAFGGLTFDDPPGHDAGWIACAAAAPAQPRAARAAGGGAGAVHGTDAADRLAAAGVLEHRDDGLPPDLARKASKDERNPRVAAALRGLIVAAGLHSPDLDQRLAAIRALGSDPTSGVVSELTALRTDRASAADPRVASAVDAALARAHCWVGIGNALSLLYDGLSVGSVLFLASAGLAILFGLMGVINLAQGELIMIGTLFEGSMAAARADTRVIEVYIGR